MSDLDQLLVHAGARVHLVGCGGAGMRALAEVGSDLGWKVTGSDATASSKTFERLAASGIAARAGHSAANVPADVQWVVHSPAVPESNVERTAANRCCIPDVSYPDVLGAISRRWPTIAVAGTHGKSTTTGLIGSMLTASEDASVVLCGAELLDRKRHGWAAGGKFAVVEACEYRQHFLKLVPQVAVVLGIEPDHFDCFPTLDDAVRAYRQFLERTQASGLALVNVDTPGARTALVEAGLHSPIETMSTRGSDADWTTQEIHQGDSLELSLCYRGRTEARVSVPLIGEHHAANVLAAYVVSRSVGASTDAILGALSRFAGLGRRLEPLAPWHGVRRFDDYAHHPTAVSAVLAALRSRQRRASGATESRLICVFQPHQVSRTERLAREFGAALSLADEAWVVPVYAAREGGGARAGELARDVAGFVSNPCQGRFIPSLDHALMTLETALRPGDIFVTLGAGDIDCLQYELPRRFP